MMSVHKNGHGMNLQEVLDEAMTAADLTAVWQQRAYALAEPPAAPIVGETLDVLIFTLQDEKYGIDVSYVVKIYPFEQLTPVPRTPDFVVGIFSTRGRLVSVIDLRTFWGLTPTPANANSKIVVIADDKQGMEIGILANTVMDVTTIFKADLNTTLVAQTGTRAGFTLGIAPGMTIILNPAVLLRDEALIVQEELT